jgi:hypothetical protein
MGKNKKKSKAKQARTSADPSGLMSATTEQQIEILLTPEQKLERNELMDKVT